MSAPIPAEQLALLAAIVAEPDEDTPRLVYADWLQENGDEEQAAFIRESVAVARAHLPPSLQHRENLRLRATAGRHQDQWFAALGVSPPAGWDFRRGLVERLNCAGMEKFLAIAPAWFRVAPIRSVVIDKPRSAVRIHNDAVLRDGELKRLAGMRELARVRTLGLWGQTWGRLSEWVALFHSPNLSKLRTLALWHCGLGPSEIQEFVSSPILHGLKRLDLSHNPLGSAGTRVLLDATDIQRLEYLWLAEVIDWRWDEYIAVSMELRTLFRDRVNLKDSLPMDLDD